MSWDEKRELLALIAQQDAASAAIASAVFSLVSVVLLAWTLHETRRTARASMQSSEEARRASNVAEQALAHAKAVSEVDLAPYLVFFDTSIHRNSSNNVEINVSYKNFGKSPAKDVKFHYGMAVGYPPLIQPPFNRDGGEHAIIAPGQAYTEHLIMPDAGDRELQDLESGIVAVLSLALDWKSIEGKPQSLIATMVMDAHAVRSKMLRLPLDMEVLPA